MRSLPTVPSFSEYLAARNNLLYTTIIINETHTENIYNIDTSYVLHKKYNVYILKQGRYNYIKI